MPPRAHPPTLIPLVEPHALTTGIGHTTGLLPQRLSPKLTTNSSIKEKETKQGQAPNPSVSSASPSWNMENPVKEIPKVFDLIDCVHSPSIQKAAIEKYFLPDAGFKYPVFQVEAGENSRDRIVKLYQWLHIISPRTKGAVTHVVYDKARNVLLLDVTQQLHLLYLPTLTSTSKMLTRLTLKRQSGLHYIAYQEDLMHPDDVAGLLLPPLKTLISVVLIWIGVGLSLFSTLVQRLGFPPPPTGPEDDLKARRKRRRANKNGNGNGSGNGKLGGEPSTMKMESSASGNTELENLNATATKILRGKRAERQGEDAGAKGAIPKN
ncbi:hypothetical protein NMY22_g8579 [Coprinellus aureogranulatus]|nr:hypothetical protein NMY22_g8579 [Coprinellus aureogranulatus]